MAKSFSYKQTFTGTELGPSPRTKSHIKITSKKTTTKTKKKTPRISLRLDNKSELCKCETKNLPQGALPMKQSQRFLCNTERIDLQIQNK